MRRSLHIIKQKLGFLTAIMVAAVVGGATTAFVQAAIPNSDGIISSCRSNLTGAVRVIDAENSETCATGETPLNWNQGNRAYATVLAVDHLESVLDPDHSQGISNLQNSPVDSGYICVTVNFTPRFVYSNTDQPHTFIFKDASNNWVNPENFTYNGECDSVTGTNLVVSQGSNNSVHYFMAY